MNDKVYGFFVSEKINKIRWKPEDFFESQTFLTGSWDNEINSIKLWTYTTPKNNSEDISPFPLETLPFKGDVTELKFLNSSLAVATSSEGYAVLLKVQNNSDGSSELKVIHNYENLHHFNNGETSPCTALSIYEEDIVTVGEDGRVNLLNIRNKKPVNSIDNADSCSLKCVCFIKHNEILTGNMRGQMKIWDLKSNLIEPVQSFMMSSKQVGATCLTYHPTQRHIILAGSEDGVITVWDLRKNTCPIAILHSHRPSVSEIHFDLNKPEKLYSCSTSGELWTWNSNTKRTANKMLNLELVHENVWLSKDLSEDKLEIISLMPDLHMSINTLDVNRKKVICGCDNEAIYIIIEE